MLTFFRKNKESNTSLIHPTARVSPSATIGYGTVIGPNVIIKDNVWIGPYCVIGGPPEHKDFYSDLNNEKSRGVAILANCRISSFTTIDGGTNDHTFLDEGVVVHNHSHIGHDCFLSKNSQVGGHTTLAGHVTLFPNSIVSGQCAVHQWSAIGEYGFLGARSFLKGNIPPGELWVGSPARPSGDNVVGIERSGLTKLQVIGLFGEVFDEWCKGIVRKRNAKGNSDSPEGERAKA